jgi:hypothetical protein
MMRRIPAQNDLDQLSAFPSRAAMGEHRLLLVHWRRPTTAVMRFHLLNLPPELLGRAIIIRYGRRPEWRRAERHSRPARGEAA